VTVGGYRGAAMAATPRDLTAEELTAAVLASFAGAASPRVREVAESLVRHLHAFVHEVGLTEDEWAAGIDSLTRAGQMSTGGRQEVVLLSDVLGVSMAVVGVNHAAGGGATESTVLGPFFVEGAPVVENGADLGAGAPGRPCLMRGTVRTTSGAPVAAAALDVWQADEAGLYDVQYPGLDAPRGRGRLHSDDEGRFWFWSVLPVAYPVPTGGPAGDVLRAAGRAPMRPAHVHFRVEADGFETLVTHIFVAGDPHLDADAVFGVKSSLIVEFTSHEPGTAPDGRWMDVAYHSMQYDLVLATRAPAAHR
jgi:hydroxyquinol 1,2-dioxygenase